MKSKKVMIIAISVAACVLVLIAVIFLFRKKGISASTMSLKETEGNVSLFSEDSGEKTIFPDIRLYSGDRLDTGDNSKAVVFLDASKLVVIEELSIARVFQERRDLVLKLDEGSIFFSVSEKLEDDESFDIETSTLMMAIRGTSGYLSTPDDRTRRLYLTSGKVSATAVHPSTKEKQKTDVNAGEVLTVTIDGDQLLVTVEKMSPSRLPSELLGQLAADSELTDTLLKENGWEPYLLMASIRYHDIEANEEVRSLLGGGETSVASEYDPEQWIEREDILPEEKYGAVFFGAYEQDGNAENGPEPIEWRVTGEEDGELILMSEYVLDCCDRDSLPAFLDDFYSCAFTQNEKDCLTGNLPVTLPCADDLGSMFDFSGLSDEETGRLPSVERIAYPTYYARHRGCYVQPEEDYASWEAFYHTYVGQAPVGASWYWLSAERTDESAGENVTPGGMLGENGSTGFAEGVRPVIRIRRESVSGGEE